jgi:hypothetical protein
MFSFARLSDVALKESPVIVFEAFICVKLAKLLKLLVLLTVKFPFGPISKGILSKNTLALLEVAFFLK